MASKAALEAVPLTARFTALPFLYQTRTLSGLRQRKPAVQSRVVNSIGTRTFGVTCPCKREAPPDQRRQTVGEADPASSVEPCESADEHKGPRIRRTTSLHYREPAVSDKFGVEEFRVADGEISGLIRKTWMVPENRWLKVKTDYLGSRSYATKDGAASRALPSQNRTASFGEVGTSGGRNHDSIDRKQKETASFDEFGTSDGYERNSIVFEGDDTYEERDAIDRLTSKMDPGQDRLSTITPSEKSVFQKLFSDMFDQHQRMSKRALPTLDLFKDTAMVDSDMAPVPNKKGAMKQVGRMISNVTKERTNAEMEQLIKRYPVALRAAAARAIGFQPGMTAEQTERERIGDEAMDNKLEELRKPERERVERLMRASTTDVELWAVMEEEVFSLIPKLGLHQKETAPEHEPRSTKAAKKLKKKSKAAAAAAEAEEEADEQPDIEPEPVPAQPVTEEGISALARDGPLYPSHLLLGLRLLDRSFSKPSMLTLSVLPKIKSLGLFSQILGGTTQLYNELMIIYWHRREDFPAILDLLAEMEQSALDWDAQTLHIVSTIDAYQKSTLRGNRSEELSMLWGLPAFSPGSFGSWREKIKQAIAGREREVDRIQNSMLY
ncbi:hypothetical protein BJ878DRAFT_498197 [Calycina marina]|uniref:Mtf2-like C-terminal domain-containing protein n=1 Tax=Calycina marina TaxID=1763456 RepID=A0A9P8CGU0_9HELO|nr:hypothetical protein BJ878DRAFT_498197 [Calycina marina]